MNRMKHTFLLLFLLPISLVAQRTIKQDFTPQFAAYNVQGSFILYDLSVNTYTTHAQERTNKGYIPASTFKIPNSLIALELGIVEDENTLMKWDGITRSIAAWNKDMTFGDAIKASCVPCYQEIARQVGVERYHKLLKKLRFGKMDVSESNLDMFWLRGNSRITPVQQIDFLKRLYKNELQVSQRSMNIVKTMLILEQSEARVLRGKTGWAVDGDYNVGWFVGWIEKAGKPYFFVTNIDAKKPDESQFIKARAGITEAILREMNLW